MAISTFSLNHIHHNNCFCFQISMNAVQDLALTVERVKICQEVTDASAKQDFLENIAKQVVFPRQPYLHRLTLTNY